MLAKAGEVRRERKNATDDVQLFSILREMLTECMFITEHIKVMKGNGEKAFGFGGSREM